MWNAISLVQDLNSWFKSSVNRFFFLLLSWDWYRADSKHLIISASTCFSILGPYQVNHLLSSGSYPLSTYASLFLHVSRFHVQSHIKDKSPLVFPHFSASVSLASVGLEASNHLYFKPLLYFRKSRTAQPFLHLSTPGSREHDQCPERRDF